MKKNILWNLIGISLIFVSAALLAVAAFQFNQYRMADKEYETIQKDYIRPMGDASVSVNGITARIPKYPALDIDFKGLMTMNPDFVGVLYVPALNIQYPIAKSKDNKEYLTRTFEGKHLASGSIFLEKDSDRTFDGLNSWIFGHNMRNGSMFGSLKKMLQDPAICDHDPYFYVYTEHTVHKYRIFAFHTTALGGPLYRYVGTKDEYSQFLEDIKKENAYETDFQVSKTGMVPLLTLSTCHGRGHVRSFVVHGALTGTYMQLD